MKIETKYNINDTVYFMTGNKVENRKIYKIEIIIDQHEKSWVTYILYGIEDSLYREEYLFPSKEKLLQSL